MHYKRRLPHWTPANTFVFVTWRLWGTLPVWKPVGTQSEGERFAAADRECDRATTGTLWLRDDRIAQIVADTIIAGERERDFYELRAWVIMPNHVHVLFFPKQPLAVITRWLKGSTARHANAILGRTGERFWQQESYDHWVRDSKELERIVRYIERNPVSAGLADSIENWRWSSAWVAGETACATRIQRSTFSRFQ